MLSKKYFPSQKYENAAVPQKVARRMSRNINVDKNAKNSYFYLIEGVFKLYFFSYTLDSHVQPSQEVKEDKGCLHYIVIHLAQKYLSITEDYVKPH